MPKGRNRKKTPMVKNKGRLDVVPFEESDDESMNDNMSIMSNVSENTSIYADSALSDDGTQDDIQKIELFEEKLSEAIDAISQKSVQGRISNLESVVSGFSNRFIPDFVIRRRITLIDCIERSLRKGRGLEQALAAQLAALLCVQLGSTEIIDEICNDLIPVLTVVITDNSMPIIARAKCCWALGMLTFIGNYEDVRGVMSTMSQIFIPACYKTTVSGNVVFVNPDVSDLHTAAISAWCLLLTVASLDNNSSNINLRQIEALLDSNCLEIRIATGELMAVILEQARQLDIYEKWTPSKELVDKLRQLATDSHKYRAKKDRKTQRSTFRDIVRYIESGESPRVQIRFGKELLSLNTWCRKKQYDAFCQALSSGMNLHLTQNDLLRDVLELGDKVTELISKPTKMERNLMNQAAFKARTISRAKNRDKRVNLL